MKVSLKAITPNAEVTMVEIARVSSGRTDKSEDPAGLINYLIRNKHWSPFEHAYMTFEIVTSKAIGIQLLRHRSFTFQEFSQRYAVVEDIEPIDLRMKADKNRQSSSESIGGVSINPSEEIEYSIQTVKGPVDPNNYFGLLDKVAQHLLASKALYKELLESGIAKECARMVLPMATQTTIFMTGSVRSWIHFIQMRVDPHAQKEAQLIGLEIRRIFKEQLPILSAALEY